MMALLSLFARLYQVSTVLKQEMALYRYVRIADYFSPWPWSMNPYLKSF